MAESVEKQVKRTIKNYPRGKIFFPENFDKLGSSTAIRKALNRLENEGILKRLAHGIYLYPREHPILGIVHPTTEEIALAIAKRDKARIIPTGQQALNKLGLSTQVPMNLIFFTDGSPRSIKIKKGTIKFKKGSPRLLSLKNDQMILVIQALKELGKDNITPEIKNTIKKVLEQVEQETVKHDIKLAPVWIKKIIKESIEQ
ncbi:DUF6088 family protein [Salinimicrobium sp. TH3]|uniref:DUF6088 family protein n=1 Tax=Salinimicrobium sp. TH3 TaxID=2997342 RepID=UPI00227234CD|nr:DUF6088 family protein [Salinimicrobium sp. TH3]MCY2685864.1 DUF6088 family protein [Salinimicrobium sp. TH3]